MRKAVRDPAKKPEAVSPSEALALLLDQGLTKEQYFAIGAQSKKKKQCDIYPLYQTVATENKLCHPDNFTVSEIKAEVSLQSLVAHTASRLVHLHVDVVQRIMEDQPTDFLAAELILNYGFNGSSGQSSYNQKCMVGQALDLNLFATTVTPLRLLDASRNVLWNNRTPQSIRFRRPLKLKFVKESKECILNENEYLKKQISNLTPCKIILENKNIMYVSS